MEQGPSDSVGVSHTKNKSKRLHDPLAMNDEIVVKQKKKVGETPKKKRRKVTYAVSRPTLPKVCV